MKYPQLSAMPSGVQDWLDEQLEARGIDPVVYTRYVLSLLRRDTLPEKGPSKRLRREDCESVRRAAAIECLMSASDQQFGMEKLVDELCAKLQEIKSLTESTDSEWQRPARRGACDWPPLAGAPLTAGAPQPMGAVLSDDAAPTVWGNADDDDTRGVWPRRLYERQSEEEDDPSLARLMAKFDQSIEALWSPEPELPVDEPPACDFPPLVSPPGSKSNVFIPSGTNITSSIWSDCADDDAATLARAGDLDGSWPDPDALATWSGQLDDPASQTGNVEGPWLVDSDEPGLCIAEAERSAVWAEPEDTGTWAPSWAAALLNHSKQESSFTENFCCIGKIVQPPAAVHKHDPLLVSFQVVPKAYEDQSPVESTRLPDPRPPDVVNPPQTDGETEVEEDLLTSTRTHFKPIRSEETATAGAAGYADGTTFVIAAGLEVLAFRRCQSGTLMLESEAPPAKYREYKEKEPYAGRYIRDDSTEELSEFVPKFRVSVNEKCCQTEAAVPEPEPDIYFPGDAGMWDGEAEQRSAPGDANVWDDADCSCRADRLAPWQQAGAWAQAGLAAIWQAPCGQCEGSREPSTSTQTGGGPTAARRLREELSRDGDQLLSDLSYIFLGSGWLHDTGARPAQIGWDAMDDDDDDDGGAPSAEKLQCLSPVECVDLGRETLRQHARSVDAFLSTCLLSALPSSLIIGPELAPWPRHTERKRRHSVCQRSVPEPPGYVRRPPCALVNHSLRPVTL